MTLDEAKAALSARGWTLHIRKRRARQFVYAARRDGKRIDERYLAALDAPELPAAIEALPNNTPAPAPYQPAKPAKRRRSRPAPAEQPASAPEITPSLPVAQPAKADRRPSPAGTLRAHLQALGFKSDYREAWFALDDTTSCKIPGGRALWNDWCEDVPEEVVRKAVFELEKRLDIPARLLWKD